MVALWCQENKQGLCRESEASGSAKQQLQKEIWSVPELQQEPLVWTQPPNIDLVQLLWRTSNTGSYLRISRAAGYFWLRRFGLRAGALPAKEWLPNFEWHVL